MNWNSYHGLPQGDDPMWYAKHSRPRQSKVSNTISMSRAVRCMSQAELAQKIGLSRRAVSDIEQGYSVPSVAAALSMAEVLELTVHDIFKLRP